MKRSFLILFCAFLPGCMFTGLGPVGLPTDFQNQGEATITPRTKGGTLTITPQTKGGTLLKGSVVWPAEVATLPSRVFNLKVYAGQTLLAEGTTDAAAAYTITGAPVNQELRLEAQVPGKPFVILRSRFKTANQVDSILTADISMLSTAAAAVLDSAQLPESLRNIAPQRLLQADTQPLLLSLALIMTPYLDANLTAPLESQPPVQSSVVETRQNLDQALRAQP
jgi:hypothetical protein